jgi:hypothetical protein
MQLEVTFFNEHQELLSNISSVRTSLCDQDRWRTADRKTVVEELDYIQLKIQKGIQEGRKRMVDLEGRTGRLEAALAIWRAASSRMSYLIFRCRIQCHGAGEPHG